VNGEKIWISTAQVTNKMLLPARTTPLEQVKRKTEGLSLFYTSPDRSRIEVRLIHKDGTACGGFEPALHPASSRSRHVILPC
jgi:acyl-CoA dehydrogenase